MAMEMVHAPALLVQKGQIVHVERNRNFIWSTLRASCLVSELQLLSSPGEWCRAPEGASGSISDSARSSGSTKLPKCSKWLGSSVERRRGSRLRGVDIPTSCVVLSIPVNIGKLVTRLRRHPADIHSHRRKLLLVRKPFWNAESLYHPGLIILLGYNTLQTV